MNSYSKKNKSTVVIVFPLLVLIICVGFFLFGYNPSLALAETRDEAQNTFNFNSEQVASIFSGVNNFVESVFSGFRILSEITRDSIFPPRETEPLSESPSTNPPPQGLTRVVVTQVEPLDLVSLKSELQAELENYVRSQIALRAPSTVVYQSLATLAPSNFQSIQTDDIIPIIYRTVTRQSDSDASRLSTNLANITDGGTFTDASISGASTFSGTTGSFNQGLTVSGGASITGDLTINGDTVITGGSINIGDKVITEGDIGIGTTSPAGKLSVLSTSVSTTTVLIYGLLNQINPIIDVWNDATNNSNLFRLTYAGNLGLGTTSPYAKLSVVGQTVAEYFTATSTMAVSSFQQLLANASTTLQNFTFVNATGTSATTTNFAISGLSNVLLSTNANGSVVATTTIGENFIPDNFLRNDQDDTTTGLLTVAGGLFSQASSTIGDGTQTGGLTISGGATTTGNAYFAGNVGIGTQSPGAALDITGTSDQVQMVVRGYSGQTSDLIDFYVSGNKRVYFDSTGALRSAWSDSGKYIVRDDDESNYIKSGGQARFSKLGIGADNAGNEGIIINFNANTGQVSYGIRATSANLGGTAGVGGFYTSRSLSNAITYANAYGMYVDTLTLSGGATATNNYGIYLNNGTAGVTNWGIYQNDANKNYFAGSVGIGTTTPTSLLQVAGATAPKFTLSDTDASANQKHWFIESDTGKFSIGTTSDALITNSTYRALTIDSSGNVGIGTVSPSAKLQVSSASSGLAPYFKYDGTTVGASTQTSINASASITSAANMAIGLNLENSSQTNNTYSPFITFSRLSDSGSFNMPFAAIGAQRTGVGSDTNWNAGDLVFGTEEIGVQGISERLRILSSGNVGIGTADPTTKVEIYSNNDPENSSATPLGAFSIRSSATTALVAGVSASSPFEGWLQVRNGGAAGLTYPLSLQPMGGSVGIGTTTPTSLLQVAGATAPKFTLSDTNASANQKHWFIESDTGKFSIGTTSDALVTNSAYRALTIDSSGKVGIGTAAPAYALDVLASGTGVIARFNSTNATGCTLADGGTITCTSDERMKKNIEDISFGLETVLDLRPVLFNWNYENDDLSKNLGFLAQDVEILIPKLVATDENGMKSLNTTGMIPILVKAVQELALKLDQVFEYFTRIAGWFDFRDDLFCVDDVCVTKEEFKAILLNAGGTATIITNDVADSTSSLQASSGQATTTESAIEEEPQSETTATSTEPTAGEAEGVIVEEVTAEEAVVENSPPTEAPASE